MAAKEGTLYCTVKTVLRVEDRIECSAFILQKWALPAGTLVGQFRDGAFVVSWEVLEICTGVTSKSIVLKARPDNISLEFGDHIHAVPPEIEESLPPPREESLSHAKEANGFGLAEPVLIFNGKNWKLASPKKWVPSNLAVEGYTLVGELAIKGKGYFIFKLPEGFAAKLKPVA